MARVARMDGKNARSRTASAIGCGEQSARARAADDADFGDASGECAFRGFEFQNHSAGNFVASNQVFNFGAAQGAKNFFAVKHACDVREENQPIGADKFRGGSGHVIGVDIVKLAVGAQAEAGSDGNQLRRSRANGENPHLLP